MERYPGSKKPVKTFETLAAPSKPRSQEDFDAFVLGEGKKMWVDDRTQLEFFTIGDLARMLNRKPVTVRKWETEGIIPKATYIKPSQIRDQRGVRRLYSRQQIEGLIKIAREEGVLEPNDNGKWKAVESTQFKERALKLFRDLEKI